jgi:hypothetical protein
LPLLFALWANTDEHFLLGPIAVGLALVGQLLQRLRPDPDTPATGRNLGRLGLVLAAGLAACLLNPGHVSAFGLPWQLGLFPTAGGLAQDQEFGQLFVSPLEAAYYSPSMGLNVAGLAVFPLALLGLASFVLVAVFARPRWWRLLVWAGFLLLGLASYRALAFFAVVAGPLLALNLLDLVDARKARAPRWLPLWGRTLGLVIAALLVVLSVPGWLQANPARRHFSLEVRIDPSLRKAAEQMREWRRQGKLDPEARTFHTTPDVACYLAWFCPQEKSFLDLRLRCPASAERDFVTARAALMGQGSAESAEPDWRPVFRRWGMRHVILHFRDARQPAALRALTRLLLSTFGPGGGEWSLCFLDGRTAIATWNDPGEKTRGPAPEPLDLNRLAFGPEVTPLEDVTSGESGKASWLMPPARRSPAAGEAACFLAVYRVLQPLEVWRQGRAWHSAVVASSVANAAQPSLPGPAGQLLLNLAMAGARADSRPDGKEQRSALVRTWRQLGKNYRATQDAGPAAPLYAGVRAARRALAEQPDDAVTHLLLGKLYVEIGGRSRESALAPQMPQVLLIRQAQTAAALRLAARLDPDGEETHALLAELAQRSLFLAGGRPRGPRSGPVESIPNLEMEWTHRQEQLRCARERGPAPGEARSDFTRRLAALEKEVTGLEKRLRRLRDRYEVAALKKPAAARAELALEHGLVETALAELRQAHESGSLEKSRGSAARLAELLVATGRLDELAGLLTHGESDLLRGVTTPLGLPATEWFALVAAVTSGQYELGDKVLTRAEESLRKQPAPAALLAQTVGHILLWEAPVATGMPGQYVRRTPALLGLPVTRDGLLALMLSQALAQLQHQANLATLRGWLALEAGNIPAARQHFERAVALGRSGDGRPLLLRALPQARLGLDRLGSPRRRP